MSGVMRWVPVMALLGWIPTTGCNEEVAGALGTDRPFSVYGVFTPQLDTQWVRVFPIDDVLRPEPAAPLDALVASVDQITGERRVWRDSLVSERTGQVAHVFWSPFAAEYGHTYELSVRRSDAATSRVEVAVPPRTEVVPLPSLPVWPVRSSILVLGGAPNLIKVAAKYDIRVLPDALVPLDMSFEIPIDRGLVQTGADWDIPFELGRSFESISGLLETLDIIATVTDFSIELKRITLKLRVVNEEWHIPDNTYDPEILVQPGTLENVENGFGFVGAGYRAEVAWLPSDEALIAARFRPPEVRELDPPQPR